MTLEYYSEAAFEKLKKRYSDLKGDRYYFDYSGEKRELFDIIKKSNDKANNKFLVLFVSKNFEEVLIVDFMKFNKMEFNCSDYNNI